MSRVDTTKYARDDTLVALSSNVRRVIHTPTSFTDNSVSGSFSFERIQPRTKHNGLKNLTVMYNATFRITPADTTKTTPLKFRFDNINAAFYDCAVSINSSIQAVQQPYINNIIKSSFNSSEFIEDAPNHHNKHVSVSVEPHKNGSSQCDYYTVKYSCCTPLYHTYFDNDLCGIDSLGISGQFNLYNIVKTALDAAETSIASITFEAGQTASMKISYDEVAYSVPLEAYNIQVPHLLYYSSQENVQTLDVSAGASINSTINVRDVKTQPLKAYLVAAPNIRGTANGNVCCRAAETYFTSVRWDINNEMNALNTSDTTDIYMTSKVAGLLSEYGVNTGNHNGGVAVSPVCAVDMLETSGSKVSTADLFRLNVESTIKCNTVNVATDPSYVVYCVYQYPSVLTVSTQGCSIIYSLNGTWNELAEIEDADEYYDALNKAQLYGGSKFGDFFKNLGRKIKEGRYVSKILNGISNTKSLNPLLSMIPGVGQVVPLIQDVAAKAAPVAESAGLGAVGMF